MGIDFLICGNCSDTFPDCGSYANCEDCRNYLCPRCMNQFNVGHRMSAEFDKCPFCSKDIITDDNLLQFALKKLNLSEEELTKLYKKETK